MTTAIEVSEPVTGHYSAPDDHRFSSYQLEKLRKSSPQLFLCQLCGIDMRLPDSGPCGFCLCSELFGEIEPALADRDESQTKALHLPRSVVVLA